MIDEREKVKYETWESTENSYSAEVNDLHFISLSEEELLANDHLLDTATSQDDSQKSKAPVGGILGCVLVIFSLAATYGWITGSWGTVETIAAIIATLIGAIVAFFTAESFSHIFLTIEAVGAVLLWIVAAIADLVMEGFSISWIFTNLLLGLFVTIPICAFPALVCTILVTALKKFIHFG